MLIGFAYPVVNETEYSLFNREAYEAFKQHPEVRCQPILVIPRRTS